MSIIIKGMDKPKDCEECRLYVDKWCYAIDVESFTEENGTKATFICPLVEIVHCKDCSYFDGGTDCNKFGEAILYNNPISDNGEDFCSWGERREE